MSTRAYAPASIVICVALLFLTSRAVDALEWDQTTTINGRTASNLTSLALSDNALHASWGSSTQAMYSRSLDGGLTWQDEYVFSMISHLGYHHVVAEGTHVVAFWRDDDGATSHVRYAVSGDEGVTWGAVGTLASGDVTLWSASVDNGVVAVLWGDGVGPYDVYTTTSLDMAATWEPSQAVASATAHPAGDIDVEAGALVVAYPDGGGMRARVSLDWGVSWSDAAILDAVARGTYAGIDVRWDGSRTVAVWGAEGGGSGVVYTATSEDREAAWSQAVAVSSGGHLSPVLVSTAGGFYIVARGWEPVPDIVLFSADGVTWTAEETAPDVRQPGAAVATPTRLWVIDRADATNVITVHSAALDFIAIAEPADTDVFSAGTRIVSLTVDVDVAGTANHWQWRDTPFPASGVGGGTPITSGATAPVPVTEGANDIYVALVDASDTLLTPSVTDSVTIQVGGATVPGGGVMVTVPDANESAGDTVSIPIAISDTMGLGIEAVSLSLSYDPTLLTPVTAYTSLLGSVFDVTTWSVEQNVGWGTWDIALATAVGAGNGPATEGHVVTIHFAVAGAAANGDVCQLTLTRADFNEGLVPASTVVGVFMVLDVVYGDVTGNGAPTAYDAAWVLGHVAEELANPGGSQPFPIELTAPVWSSQPVEEWVADLVANVDPSDDIAAVDAAWLLQYDVGLVAVLPIPPSSAAPTVVPTASAYDIRGLAASHRPGARITVTLDASRMPDVRAGELVLDFDGALLRPIDVSMKSSPGATPSVVQREADGRLAVAFASARPMNGDNATLIVTFEATRDVYGARESVIRASHLRLNGSLVETDFAFPFRIEPFANRLMANYPNPFNPETWIPFELSEAADVTVRIYGIAGDLVRTLELGALAVGEYVARDDAAYWDGRNAAGEAVASGVYIYELTAGDYHAVRRMLVLK